MENINKAFSEVSDILKHFDINMYRKIPNNVLNFIDDNKESNYKFNIDYSLHLKNQELLPETKAILTVLYRDYICNSEKRNYLIEQDNLELKREEEVLIEKYSYKNLFKNKNEKNIKSSSVESNHKEMITYKESFLKKMITKLINYIKPNR